MHVKRIVVFLISWCLLCSCAFSTQRGVASENATPSEVTTAAANTEAEAPRNNNCVGRQVETCIAIDRNPAVQTMLVYRNGRLASTYPISTGRETFDIPTNFERNPGCSNTPTGSFTVSGLFESYYSNTWRTDLNGDGRYTADERAEMPYAIRLRNSAGTDTGIFLHAATTEAAINALGPKATVAGLGSGGCIRMDPRDAQTLFESIAGCATPGEGTRYACIEREINTPTARRLTCNRGTSQLPIACCERGEQQRTCNQFTGGSPRCNDDSAACVQAQQAAVTRRGPVAVEIMDSRSDQGASARAACERNRQNYENLFANCVARKLGSQSVTAFNALSDSVKQQYRAACNEEIYRQTQPAATAASAADVRDAPAPEIPASNAPRTPFFEGIRNWFRGLTGR